MYTVAKRVMVVTKSQHTFDNGDTVYRVGLTNGSGELVNVECDSQTHAALVPLDKRYDVQIDFFNVGFSVRNFLVSYAESKEQ